MLTTIAFPENDRETRDRVAAAADSRGNAMNAKLLDKLVAGFGKGYKAATSAQ